MMAGVETDVDGAHCESRAPTGQRGRLRLRATGGNRLGAGSLLDTLVFATAPASTPPGGPPQRRAARGPRRSPRLTPSWSHPCVARPPVPSAAVSEVKGEPARTMNEYVAVSRAARAFAARAQGRAAAPGGSARAYVDDRGSIFDQDVLGAPEGSAFHARVRPETIVLQRSGRESQFPTAPVPHRSRPRQTEPGSGTSRLAGRRPPPSPRIDYAPVTITQWQPRQRTY